MPKQPHPHPFPPLPISPQPFPADPPLSSDLAELSGWWLEIRCEPCRYNGLPPLRMLAAQHGWETQLSALLPRFRCQKCGQAPTSIDLIDSAQKGQGQGVSSGEPLRLRLV